MSPDLQEPEAAFELRRDAGSIEVRGDFSDHFGVFDGNREVLLLDGFPVYAAELVDLVDEVADGVGVGCICGIDAFYAEFDGERETIVWVESGLFVAGVVAEEVTACTKVDVSSAVWHEVIAGSIEEDLVFGFGLVDGDDVYGDVKVQLVQAVEKDVGFFCTHDFVVMDDEPCGLAFGSGKVDDGFFYRSSEFLHLVFQEVVEGVEYACVLE